MAAERAGAYVEASLAGEPVWLLGARALFWVRERRLFLSDLHLGKGDVFRRAGIALPSGGTADDLSRLSAAIRLTGATSVWILGDVLHGPVHASDWRAAWAAWRDAHLGVGIAALSGNHDRALAGAGLGVELLGPAHDSPPFALRHEPEAPPDGLHVLGGHLHPGMAVPGLGTRRWPAFWLRPGLTVLPAFSRFTGGSHMALGPRDGAVVCADGVAAWVRRPPPEPPRSRHARRA